VAAARTDRGVSARMQVLSARVPRDLSLEGISGRLGAVLPKDLGVHLVREVAHGFHAAWSSTSKEYRYQLEAPGDREALREAAALVPGTRDFRVFHFKTSEQKPRTVRSVDLEGDTLRFVGDAFGRHMVRMLVGGLLAVSRGEVPVEVFREGLEHQAPFHCPTAPPEPLTLWAVGYPPELDPFSATERAGFAPKT
jgi:tRNA pseudouridine38-40 synthase